ncbi:MAG: radical SAM protein [Lachnospiraceae bacterium]|nr:radical SAM protein [Lachnospiraceae bacterium]
MDLKEYAAKKFQNICGLHKYEAKADEIGRQIENRLDKLNDRIEAFGRREFDRVNTDNYHILERCLKQISICERSLQEARRIGERTDKNKLELERIQNELNDLKNCVNRFVSKQTSIDALVRADFIQHLDYHIVHHCNLNCKSCSTFSPIADETYVDVKRFAEDLRLLHEVAGDSVLQIHILGGEPLLHPDIEHFLAVARTIFPEASIDITTNGLLIKKMNPSFWCAMKDNDIAVKYTRYPIHLDYDEMVEYIQSMGVHTFSAGGQIEKFRRIPLNSDGTENAKISYFQCPYIDCTTLRDGKLFRCPASAFVDLVNKRLETNLRNRPFKWNTMDYIELSKATRDDIFKFLSKAIPFCSYCKFSRAENIKWGLSDQVLSEWVEI